MDLNVLSETIDHLVAEDPSAYGDAESMEVLQHELARLESFVTNATAAFDASGGWAPDGARNGGLVGHPVPAAQGPGPAAGAPGPGPVPPPGLCPAWSAGEISGAHVDTIAALRRPATEAALDRDEALLVDQARTLRYESFVRAVAYWEQLADPDGTEEEAEARRARRQVYLEASFAGLWLGKMTLDPIAGAIVGGELERLEGELFEADWAEARASLGRDPSSATRPDPGPAPGRRPGRDGHPLPDRPRGWAPPRPVVQRAGGLADTARADL